MEMSGKKSFWKPRSSMSHATAAAADDDDEMLPSRITTFL
jgi:hypothetical protein